MKTLESYVKLHKLLIEDLAQHLVQTDVHSSKVTFLKSVKDSVNKLLKENNLHKIFKVYDVKRERVLVNLSLVEEMFSLNFIDFVIDLRRDKRTSKVTSLTLIEKNKKEEEEVNYE